MGSLLSKENTVLYLDGGVTKEKQATANRRQQIKERDSKKMEALLKAAEIKACQGRRVSTSQIDAITRLSRRMFKLTDHMKAILTRTAEEQGWKIILCNGEADVHIGGLDLDENAAVISGDSDLLFYRNTHVVLRPTNSSCFLKYKKADILSLLRLGITMDMYRYSQRKRLRLQYQRTWYCKEL
jgi:hypothetical protein